MWRAMNKGNAMTKSRIQLLIENRCTKLGISIKELLVRTGLADISKAQRRLDELYGLNFRSARGLIERLPAALNLPKKDLDQAIKDTIQDARTEKYLLYRSKFKPHALILTEENGRPKQIAIAGFLNAGRYIRIEFSETASPDEYLNIALKELEKRRDNVHSLFYPICGLTVNYTPDNAKTYDLNGHLLNEAQRASSQGIISLSFR